MIPAILDLALQHFPRHRRALESLYLRNESFRALCQDFHDCTRAMEYWCKSRPVQKNAEELCDEYKALCLALIKEMETWLRGHDPSA